MWFLQFGVNTTNLILNSQTQPNIKYLLWPQGKLSEAAFQLTGSNAYAARFGETVVDLGDLDDDGFPGTDHSNTTRPLAFYIFTRTHDSNSNLVLIAVSGHSKYTSLCAISIAANFHSSGYNCLYLYCSI